VIILFKHTKHLRQASKRTSKNASVRLFVRTMRAVTTTAVRVVTRATTTMTTMGAVTPSRLSACATAATTRGAGTSGRYRQVTGGALRPVMPATTHAVAAAWTTNGASRTSTTCAARGRPKLGGGGRGGGGGGGARRKPAECVDFDSDDVGRKSGGGKGRGKGGDKRKKKVAKEKQTFEEAPMVMMMDDESQSGFEDYEDAFDGAGEDEVDDFDAMSERQLELADQGRGATVKHVEFVQACASLSGCPKPTLPEIAVIGRSNVGKSSLVNMLTNRKSLAKTSKNPGKTQTINHYRMTTGEGKFYLVDLPGYGFANAPEHLREKWAEFTREYLLKRESLITVLLLIDSTVKPQRLDLECLDWLGEAGVPVTIVFTKVDKRKKIATGKRVNPQENVEIFCREVSQYWDELPPMLYTSSVNGEGKKDVLNHIATLRQFFKKPLKEADALAFGGDEPEREPATPEPVASRDDDDDEIEDFKDFDDEPDDDWN